MDADRFDGLLTALTKTRGRRVVVRVLGGFGLAGLFDRADAKKKKHKHKHKQTCPACPDCPSPPPPPPPPPPPLTCSQSCPSVCQFCFVRPAAPTMCGDEGGAVNCNSSCTTDADCPPGLPFCISHLVIRATEVIAPGCPHSGFCVQIPACA
jgi:hypothetical protein